MRLRKLHKWKRNTQQQREALPKLAQGIKQDEKLTSSCQRHLLDAAAATVRGASGKFTILISSECLPIKRSEKERNREGSVEHKLNATCILALHLASPNRLVYANGWGHALRSLPIAHCVCKQSQNQIISISNLELVFVASLFGEHSPREVLGNVFIQSNLFIISIFLFRPVSMFTKTVWWCMHN